MTDVRFVPNKRGGGRLQTTVAVGTVLRLDQGDYVKVSGQRWESVRDPEVVMADTTVAHLLVARAF